MINSSVATDFVPSCAPPGATRRDKVRGFLARHFGDHVLADDENIFVSGYVNSLFTMQLVLFVESTFACQVDDQDLDIANFQSVNAICAFIDRKLEATA